MSLSKPVIEVYRQAFKAAFSANAWPELDVLCDLALQALTQPKDVKRPAADDCSLSVAELRRLVLERGGEIERLEKELEDWQAGRKERTAYMAKSYSKSFAAKAIFFRKRACELSAEIDTLKAALEQQGAQGWMPEAREGEETHEEWLERRLGVLEDRLAVTAGMWWDKAEHHDMSREDFIAWMLRKPKTVQVGAALPAPPSGVDQ